MKTRSVATLVVSTRPALSLVLTPYLKAPKHASVLDQLTLE